MFSVVYVETKLQVFTMAYIPARGVRYEVKHLVLCFVTSKKYFFCKILRIRGKTKHVLAMMYLK